MRATVRSPTFLVSTRYARYRGPEVLHLARGEIHPSGDERLALDADHLARQVDVLGCLALLSWLLGLFLAQRRLEPQGSYQHATYRQQYPSLYSHVSLLPQVLMPLLALSSMPYAHVFLLVTPCAALPGASG